MSPTNPTEVINFSDVRTVEPYIILNGLEGHCLPCYGLKAGTRFYDDCGDQRKADDDTIIFFRDGKWIIRFTYEMNSVIDDIESDYPVCEEAENFEIINNVYQAAFNNPYQNSISKFLDKMLCRT